MERGAVRDSTAVKTTRRRSRTPESGRRTVSPGTRLSSSPANSAGISPGLSKAPKSKRRSSKSPKTTKAGTKNSETAKEVRKPPRSGSPIVIPATAFVDPLYMLEEERGGPLVQKHTRFAEVSGLESRVRYRLAQKSSDSEIGFDEDAKMQDEDKFYASIEGLLASRRTSEMFDIASMWKRMTSQPRAVND